MDVSYFAVAVAAVVAYGIGAVWHSPIGFGKQWMGLMGLTPEKMRSMPLTATQAMVLGFVFYLVTAYVFAYIASLIGAMGVGASMELGFWVWLGFLAPTLANGWLWEGKSFKLLAFNAFYALVFIEVIAAVIGWLQ